MQIDLWLADDTEALDESCTLETGPASNPVVAGTLSCCFIPVTDEQDDVDLKLLVKDSSSQVAIGHRIVYDSTRHLVQRIQRDGNYARLFCQVWSG